MFKHAVFWPKVGEPEQSAGGDAAYAARFAALGGVMLNGDARSLHRSGNGWRVDTDEGALDAPEVVVALGPWAPDVLEPLGIKLPMAVKRGYHRHFQAEGNADAVAAGGRCRLRLSDHADGAGHPPHHRRGIRRARCGADAGAVRPADAACAELFPLGERADDKTWMGARPCFPDSRPVIGRAPGQTGLWLAIGHAHWGLTLGPATGRLIAEMMAGETPFCDPAPLSRRALPRTERRSPGISRGKHICRGFAG